MIIATWNVRGMQQIPRQDAAVGFMKKHKVDIMGFLGTKLGGKNYETFLKKNFQGWRHIDNFDLINNGRILVMWNPAKVDVSVISVEKQVIHTEIRCITTNNSFNFSVVYALYTVPDRRVLWDSLIDNIAQDKATIISGDFNCIISPDERIGVNDPAEYELKDFVDTCACEALLPVEVQVQVERLFAQGSSALSLPLFMPQ